MTALARPVPLVLATGNPHKLREFARLLGDAAALDPTPADFESPEETGETYADNALIKARAAALATGRAAFADDSGIEAQALDWRPGVRTARYAGPQASDEENLVKFIAEVPPGSVLRYVCVIAHIAPDGAETLLEGTCTGTMAPERRGTRGFGYDPIFVPDATGPADARTMAELSDEEKDAISHRGEAARRLAQWLRVSAG